MILKHRQATLFLIALFGCLAISLAGDAPGYVYMPGSSSSSSTVENAASEMTYDDNDLVNMIAHNLGVLNPASELSESTKDVISKFGSKTFLKQQKINYLFLVESQTSSLLNTNNGNSGKSSINHVNTIFDLCSRESVDGCILDLLYGVESEGALISILRKATKQRVEAYLYSSDINTARYYPKNSLSLKGNANGNLIIHDNGSNQAFNLKTDISQCVNILLDGQYKVNILERTITPVAEGAENISFDSANQEEFIQYMNDLCSISSISTLIRRDNNPSFFTFYINSLAKLEKLVTPEQANELYKIFNIAYTKFVQNVKKYYADDEITGQFVVISPNNSLERKYEKFVSKIKGAAQDIPEATVLIQGRALETATTEAPTQTTDNTTTVIFRSVLIGFVLISLWIWLMMFNMEIQKDTIVYAKFLAADYFRR